MAEFLAMGGHGFFVWTSYAIVLVTLVLSYLLPLKRLRKALGNETTNTGKSGNDAQT